MFDELDIATLKKKQQELDNFVLKSRGLTVLTSPKPRTVISEEELLKNMILACFDEIREVLEQPQNAEEWVDVLHFLLSISNKIQGETVSPYDLNFNRVFKYMGSPLKPLANELMMDMLKLNRLLSTFKHWSSKPVTHEAITSANVLISVMIENINIALHSLGTDMLTEYEKKYQINIERQKNNY